MGIFMFSSLSRKMFSRFKPLQRRGQQVLWAGRGRRKVWGREGQESRKGLWVDEGPGWVEELGLPSSGVERE